ncbi:O-methyltransferase [Mesorhizobium australicum]|uniref:O-methyltransferase n=1 Tax=Mesorhizobium australicum TaxID=536018 RepID=UPI003335C095
MARPPRSTGNFISYDLRPGKQSERRILMDLLRLAGDGGLNISSYRYLGMGANRFYDFLLLHKYLGISNMVSLEHDPVMHRRAVFNCPYTFIAPLGTDTTTYLGADNSEDPTVVWFDYDSGLSLGVTQDIATLGTKLKLNDFCFVTVYGGPPRVIDNANDADRLVWLQDTFGPLAGSVDIADAQKAEFPSAVHKVLLAAVRNAFAQRRDGRFFPFLQIEYADSKPMVTVGGALMPEGQIIALRQRIRAAMPFLMSSTDPKFYEIKSLHLTERERALFDRATTSPSKRSAERNQIRRLGFRDAEVSAYKDLLRYFPRYVEAMI